MYLIILIWNFRNFIRIDAFGLIFELSFRTRVSISGTVAYPVTQGSSQQNFTVTESEFIGNDEIGRVRYLSWGGIDPFSSGMYVLNQVT
jgi:hypothetical protein